MKLAYVVPRYGAQVIGGAEYGARMLAERLVSRAGWEVEVLTTCALDARTWADELPAGTSVEAGVHVHRFPVVGTRHPHFDRLSPQVLHDPEGAAGPAERAWVDRQGPVSPQLLEALRCTDADLVAFYPYLYHPTVAGVPLAAGRAVMHPAAHDEPPLRLPLFRDVFAGVDGFVFQTDGERELVEGLFPVAHRRRIVLGLGVEPEAGDPADHASISTRENASYPDGFTSATAPRSTPHFTSSGTGPATTTSGWGSGRSTTGPSSASASGPGWRAL